jgi:hypothetical protein
MSVSTQLGLDGDSELLEQARTRWATWVSVDGRLGVVNTFDELPSWLRTADWEAADEVLLALAMLAAPDGGDDVAAAGALAKCLLPGACMVAARLSRLSPAGHGPSERQPATATPTAIVDQMVASQLWIEVRSFPWRRLRKVAANILQNTRAGVLRECGASTQVRRVDRTWANTDPAESLTTGQTERIYFHPECPPPINHGRPAGFTLDMLASPEADGELPSAVAELGELLTWACEHQVISPRDGHLLLCLVDEASRVEVGRSRGCGGLLSDELATRVAPRLGVSGATVRRRASQSIRAIADAGPGRFVYEPLIVDAA